jgi:hypothetical protein
LPFELAAGVEGGGEGAAAVGGASAGASELRGLASAATMPAAFFDFDPFDTGAAFDTIGILEARMIVLNSARLISPSSSMSAAVIISLMV